MPSKINPTRCPVCNGHSLTADALNAMGSSRVEQDYECDDCHATWTLVYGITECSGLKSDDAKLSPQQLHTKYNPGDGSWGQHPKHLREDWQEEAGGGLTQIGYWEWVASCIEQEVSP